MTEIKTVPYVPLSQPFAERLIGTIRREYLDRNLFWSAIDLERKLLDFQNYYNAHRTHLRIERASDPTPAGARPALSRYWQPFTPLVRQIEDVMSAGMGRPFSFIRFLM